MLPWAALLWATACLPLDREAALRQEVGRYVFLAQTREFRSTARCTAASFAVISEGLRQTRGARPAYSLDEALHHLRRGRVVAFAIPGASPNMISARLMTLAPPEGAGLVAAVVTPARGCMSDSFRSDMARVLASPETMLIYDPARRAALLLHRPLPMAFYLRAAP